MADLQFTAALNDKAFLAGLNRIEKESAKTSKAFTSILRSGFVGAVIAKSFGYASQAMDEYAKTNAVAASNISGLEESVSALQISIGRDLAGAFSAVAGPVTDFIKGVEAARTATVNWLADLMGGDGTAANADAELAQQEAAMTRYAEAAEKLKATNTGETALGELSKLAREAALARMEALDPAAFEKGTAADKRDEQLRKVAEQYALLTPEQQKSVDLQSIQYDIASKYNQTLGDINMKAQEAAEAAAKEAADIQAAADARNQELDLSIAGREIDNLRLTNQNDRAELAALELDYARQINEVLADTTIHELDRVAAAQNLVNLYNEARDATQANINQRAVDAGASTRARTLASGLGSGLSAQVLGVGAGVANDSKAVTTATLTSAQKLTEAVTLLKQIRDKNAGAAFQ